MSSHATGKVSTSLRFQPPEPIAIVDEFEARVPNRRRQGRRGRLGPPPFEASWPAVRLSRRRRSRRQSLAENQNAATICLMNALDRDLHGRRGARFSQTDAGYPPGRRARKKQRAPQNGRNPLQSHDSDDRLQANPSKAKSQIEGNPSQLLRIPRLAKTFQIAGP